MVDDAGRKARRVVEIEAVAVDLVLEGRAGLDTKCGISAVEVGRDKGLTILSRCVIDVRAEIDQRSRRRLVCVAKRIGAGQDIVVEARAP